MSMSQDDPSADPAAPAGVATANEPAIDPTAATAVAAAAVAAPPPATAAPRALRRASFAARFAAIVIDLAVLAFARLALSWTARAAVATAGLLESPLAGASGLAEILAATGSFVLPAVYFTALHAGEGRTPGKHAMHLRVARPDGSPIGLGRSLLRWFGYELSAIPLGLGFAMALGPRRRALHDLLADTVVLDLGPGGRP